MSIEDVEKIMEETQEGIEYQRELDSILAGSLTDEDESLILNELDELLESEQVGDINFPSVPDTKLPEIQEKSETAEIRNEPVAMLT